MNNFKYDVGTIHQVNDGKIEVIEYINYSYRKIKFIETGFTTITRVHGISNKYVRDYLKITVYNVGYIGQWDKDIVPYKHPLYNRWRSMLQRCYDKNAVGYKDYGGNNITVCNEWHCFLQYVNDIEKKDNYINLLNDSNHWHIDKDYNKSKIYNNESTMIVSAKQNMNIKQKSNTGEQNISHYKRSNRNEEGFLVNYTIDGKNKTKQFYINSKRTKEEAFNMAIKFRNELINKNIIHKVPDNNY